MNALLENPADRGSNPRDPIAETRGHADCVRKLSGKAGEGAPPPISYPDCVGKVSDPVGSKMAISDPLPVSL